MIIKKIIFPSSTTFPIADIPVTLTRLGYDVVLTKTFINFQQFSDEEKNSLVCELPSYTADAVISHDFSPSLAEACYELHLPYISWVFDAPLESLYSTQAQYSTNYFFVFDKNMIAQLSNVELPHLYYMPLATNINSASMLEITELDELKYSSDISLVGNLYDYNVYDRFKDHFSPALLENIQELFNGLFGRWNDSLDFHNKLTENSLGELYLLFGKNVSSCGMPDLLFLESALIRGLSYRERVAMLNRLAESHSVVLYTKSDTSHLVNVTVNGAIDYSTETPKVFHLSKINLNLTMRSIESGIPQRIFDIMAVGGFVLTNYQPELEECFVVGKEIVCFHDFDEMEYLADYYLAHDRERTEIAINGYKRVLSDYSYEIALKKILKIVESNID